MLWHLTFSYNPNVFWQQVILKKKKKDFIFKKSLQSMWGSNLKFQDQESYAHTNLASQFYSSNKFNSILHWKYFQNVTILLTHHCFFFNVAATVLPPVNTDLLLLLAHSPPATLASLFLVTLQLCFSPRIALAFTLLSGWNVFPQDRCIIHSFASSRCCQTILSEVAIRITVLSVPLPALFLFLALITV